jgi:hypothetical protein
MMNESYDSDKLSEFFFEYTAYLVFMARQIIEHKSPYGHFALIKSLDKILQLRNICTDINDPFYKIIIQELEDIRGTSSSDIKKWVTFLDKLILLYTEKIKKD